MRVHDTCLTQFNTYIIQFLHVNSVHLSLYLYLTEPSPLSFFVLKLIHVQFLLASFCR